MALLAAIIISFLGGVGWYLFFGYDNAISLPENIVNVFITISFWRGFGIWSILYFVFVTLPISLLRKRSS